jgi:hypothetical protein
MENSTSDNEKWFTKNWVIILAAFLVMACVIGFYFYEFSLYTLFDKDLCINTTGDEADCLSKDAARWGTFGDFFGGTLNPILSFLALMVLLRTFSMQREELDLQREELKETKAILKEQFETQKRQQFENTFFELLKVHNQALESCQSDLQRLMGGGIFSRINYRWIDLKKTTLENGNEKPIKTDINDTCGHYFRVLYQLLKFIANSNDEINKKFDDQNIEHAVVSNNEKMYSNIVRASLTDDVMKVLSINCYCEHGKNDIFWKYKLLIERYAFFEHASFAFEKQHSDYSLLKEILRPRWYYAEKAFGNQKPSQNQEKL